MSRAKPDKADRPSWARLQWRRTGRRRVAAGLVVALAVALVGVIVAETPEDTTAQSKAQSKPVPPGLQPGVQKWLKSREKFQIELNDALVPVVQKKLGTAEGSKVCKRLGQAVHLMVVMSNAPHPKVNEYARVGLAQFEQGVAACEAGNVAEAERVIAEGLAARAAVSLEFDELLEGH
jgi:hypothetical protein